jgi:hypothetical protein
VNAHIQQWLAFLKSDKHLTRLLYAGAASYRNSAPLLSPPEATHFIDRLRTSTESVMMAGSLHCILHPATRQVVMNTIPRLLRALTRRRVSQHKRTRGVTRGKINWPATIRGRALCRLSEAEYAITQHDNTCSTHENHVLYLVLRHASELCARLTKSGANLAAVAELHATASRSLRTFNRLGVSYHGACTSLMKQRARRMRDPVYGQAVEAEAVLSDLVDGDPWAAYLKLICDGWIQPAADDKLFELYMLAVTIDVCAEELGFGDPVESGLITAGRKWVARFRRESGQELRIYFDNSPPRRANQGPQYAVVTETYAVALGKAKRPDIRVTLHAEQEERHVLVEVKKTSDDAYMLSSVYKCFAYLYDYSYLFPDPGQSPKLILAYPADILLRPGRSDHALALTLVSAEPSQRARYAELLRAGLGLNVLPTSNAR